jgi:HEAT repeat protein
MRSERGVPALAEVLLRPEDVKLRAVAADSLGAIGGRASADALLKALADPGIDPTVRAAAQRAMERLAPTSASLARLSDPSAAVRQETIRLIGQAEDPSLAALLIEKLNDPDSEVRDAAVGALARLVGEPSVVAAIATTAQTDPDAFRRVGAVRVLGFAASPPARAALIAALGDGNPSVRATAAEALVPQATAAGGADEVPADVSAALRRAAEDASNSVRLSSARALAALRDPESEEVLKKMTQDASPEVREAAFDALARRTRAQKE